jgi:hypothetical protein
MSVGSAGNIWKTKAAISIGLAFREVNINNKNVTGSPKMQFNNLG